MTDGISMEWDQMEVGDAPEVDVGIQPPRNEVLVLDRDVVEGDRSVEELISTGDSEYL